MGLKTIFWVDVLTAAVGISLLLMIKAVYNDKSRASAPENALPPKGETDIEPTAPAAETQSTLPAERHVIKEMLSGIRYVLYTKWLMQFFGFYLIYSLMFGPVMFLTPLMVARSFGDDAWRLVAHEIVFAVGMTAGGLTVGALANKFKNKVFMVMAACVAFGVTTLVMGFSFNFWFYLGVMLVMGATVPFVNTGSMTVLQLRVQPELMGRVFSLVSIVGSGTMPLSMAIFGPISDAVSVESLLIFTGALMILIALAAFRAKEMMAAGKPYEAAA
jgi:DHA3 family macrolide efflux protein-like MFS transporter